MLNWIKKKLDSIVAPPTNHKDEIDKLRAELAYIRHLSDNELRGMIVNIRFDTIKSIEELRREVEALKRSGATNSKTTQEFILDYFIKGGTNPADILRH